MKERENSLNPENIDRQTETISDQLSPEESRLVQSLYAHTRAYARENERSLERIWQRLAQSQEQPTSLQEAQHPGAGRSFSKGKAMQERDLSGRIDLPTLDSRPTKRPRRSVGHVASTIGAVAIVALIILSWAFLTYGLKHGTPNHTVNSGHTTQTGAAQQQVIRNGKLLCSFSDNNNTLPLGVIPQPWLSWSSQGQIAAAYQNLEIAHAQNCAVQSSPPLSLLQASWSPDGTRLLALNTSYVAQVLDPNTGKVIASYQGNQPQEAINLSAWSSNGTQVVSEVIMPGTSKTGGLVSRQGWNAQSGEPGPLSIQVWNASNGNYIRTDLTFPAGVKFLGAEYNQPSLSANGNYVAVQLPNNSIQVWNVATGKQVGTIPYDQSDVSAVALSPDGSLLAIGLLNAPKAEVQIWSTATGKLTASFTDTDTWAKVVGWLAFSPNGKYLAESASSIHIWNVQAKQIVATFGKVDKSHWITDLTWSPDSTMLASSTLPNNPGKPVTKNTISVWKLS